MILNEIFDKVQSQHLFGVRCDIFLDEFKIAFNIFGYYWNDEQAASNSKGNRTKNLQIGIHTDYIFTYDRKYVSNRMFPIKREPGKNGMRTWKNGKVMLFKSLQFLYQKKNGSPKDSRPAFVVK